MKYIIEWIFKGLVTFTVGSMTEICLVLLALLMWDGRFYKMTEEITEYIWKTKK